jgi:hypothetical protein
MGSYALGYYTPPLPPGEGPESVSPGYAVGAAGSDAALGGQDLLEEVIAATSGGGHKPS